MQIFLCHILSFSHQHPDMRHLHRVLSVRKCQTFKPLAVLLFPKPTGVSFPLIALLLFWQCVHGGQEVTRALMFRAKQATSPLSDIIYTEQVVEFSAGLDKKLLFIWFCAKTECLEKTYKAVQTRSFSLFNKQNTMKAGQHIEDAKGS